MKTAELTGAALDWAVAKCEGRKDNDFGWWWDNYKPSTDWTQGGPIIEREAMCISRTNKTKQEPWAAFIDGYYWVDGSTPLIAAMRCYVASNLGAKIEIPKELNNEL